MVRADLPEGLQAAQAVHAAFELAARAPDVFHPWWETSNYLVIVQVPDEEALIALQHRAADLKTIHVMVIEPDIGNQVTALALEPTDTVRKLCANLPLALRSPIMSA